MSGSRASAGQRRSPAIVPPRPSSEACRARPPQRPRSRAAAKRRTRRATVPALEAMLFEAAAGARPRLRPGDRLHGRRRARSCRRRASPTGRGTRRVSEDARADPLSDAPPAHHAVRDVRDQVSREAADLRGPAVDPPPHRQRERVFGPLFDPRPRILPARAGAPGGAEQGRAATQGDAGDPVRGQCRARLATPLPSASNKQGRDGVLRGRCGGACCARSGASRTPPSRSTRSSWATTSGPASRASCPDRAPVNAYTQWYWKTDLHNLMHFLALRTDPHAQYEIRVYAEVLQDVMCRWVAASARPPSRNTDRRARPCRRRRFDAVRRMPATARTRSIRRAPACRPANGASQVAAVARVSGGLPPQSASRTAVRPRGAGAGRRGRVP